MQYSDIKNLVYLYTKTNSTSLPDASMVTLVNRALERVVQLINASDSRWEFDDTNQTDLPIATTALVSGQKDYSLTTGHLSINRVEIKDTSGNWHLLEPFNRNDIRFEALTNFLGTGMPTAYDKLAASIFLSPTPNYAQDASLKIYFSREPVAFLAADTLAVPGFNALFHKLLPLWASYDYSVANGLKNANQIFIEITRMETELVDFYGQRSRDERPRMSVSTDRSGAISGRLSGFSDSNR